MTTNQPRSALALALDGTRAQALLVERVDGRPRLVAVGEAPTAAIGPLADAATGARAAIAQIEAAVGRTLFTQGTVLRPRAADGAGVDAASLVVDAPLSIRVAACGDRVAVAAGRRVVESLGFAAAGPIELRAGADPADLARRLRRPHDHTMRASVDALVLLGPADAAALGQLGQALALLAPSGPSAAPIVLWAGETAGAEVARNALGGRAELRVVEPVVQRAELESPAPLRDALLALWSERLEVAMPGAEAVARWVDGRPLPYRWAEGLALGHLAAQRGQAAWLARVAPAHSLLRHASAAAPRDVTAGACGQPAPVSDRVRPWALASDHEALRTKATAALRLAAQAMPGHTRPSAARGAGLLIGAGRLAELPTEDAFRAIVDGLEPRGAVQVLVDELDGLAALGGLAELASPLAAGALADDLLRPFGAVVAPDWRTRAGAASFRFRATVDGKAHEPAEVGAGETRRVRLGEGEAAAIQVERAAWWDLRRFFDRVSVRLEGGPIGLVLDGRPRPTAGPLSLGREPIVDDAAAPRALADLVASRPIVVEPSLLRRTRPTPPDARMLVGPGDVVEAHELVAQPHEADGVVHELIPAGRLLGVGDPRPFLTVSAGARVAAGEVIARRRTLFGLIDRTVRAPIDGVVAPDQGGYGNVALMAAGVGEGVVAHLPGIVVGILPDQGIVIETTGRLVSGAVGFGPAVRGPLLPPAARLDGAVDMRGGNPRGAVAVLDVLDTFQFDLLRSSGAAGAVVGSVTPELAEKLAAAPPEIGIVAVEGIGRAPLCAPACALLADHVGDLACLSPAETEVVVPLAAPGARLAADLKLAEGALVRVVDDTTRLGRVAAIATAPTRLDSGLWVRVAQVDVESGERLAVPLPNLELVG